MSARQTAAVVDLAAAGWAARLDARALTADERRALDAWLAADVRHLGALARARALLLSRLDAPFPVGAPVTTPAGSAAPGRVPLPSRRGLLAAAASVAGLAALGAGMRQPAARQAYSSAVGEVRHIPLDDGSTLTLNTDSAVTLADEAGRRLVYLERGEAFFEVASRTDRPFVLRGPLVQLATNDGACCARLNPGGAPGGTMTVAVVSGTVAVEGAPSALAETLERATGRDWTVRGGQDAVLAAAGQQVSVRAGGAGHGTLVSVETMAPGALDRALMWREGRLAFAGETLAQAVADFARYSRRRIVLASDRLAPRHVSGLFNATDIDGFAHAVAVAFNAKYRQEGDVIILYD
ncbi:FecR family protein [Nitrospirillum sp. BR 11828]|uniref:FecR family protein n=1 Tax=Nitrospirillum sp. BR 11828 TaxID=3104325 RepID=UPI002ACA63C6|nr:FecR domain-containing protein [Nitrospirillum sp. BR 11828]MDZ5646409.1 FecR domain-containing protein [Nitrospirillum sp. BR 11828]